jgi:TolB protein
VTAFAQRQPLLESPVTTEREVRYVDRYPPEVPKELVALAEPTQIRLVWRAVEEPADLVGYWVYRRVGDGSFEKITPQPLSAPEYIDTNVTSGTAYGYRIVALDPSGNESDPSTEARTRVP